ncbi:RNB domain-containing ribonuclease [Candidatus Saccharibacteria bacterium]|nr:MAG: RNB domain-containing ribonuclease [Candidatus Saccharibacteria bacterium]
MHTAERGLDVTPLYPRGTNWVELDGAANRLSGSELSIITADCSNPREIDDGIYVRPYPFATERYRVSVCVADTSKLHNNQPVFLDALNRTEAKYFELGGGEQGYEPMIDPDYIRDLELTAGHKRSALIVSFDIGERLQPSGLDVAFGHVRVTDNLSYKQFGKECEENPDFEPYGRASALILKHLGYTSGGDNDEKQATESLRTEDIDFAYDSLVYGLAHKEWLRGSKINEAFMVAANHLVGKMMAEEGWPAIYRVHTPENGMFPTLLPSEMATYSQKPGEHSGLNLSHYCRVTSPLRRLEDFIMSRLLRARHTGQTPKPRDYRDVEFAVNRLNLRIAHQQFDKPVRLTSASEYARRLSAIAVA